jgi:hypothetical protein
MKRVLITGGAGFIGSPANSTGLRDLRWIPMKFCAPSSITNEQRYCIEKFDVLVFH